MKLKLHRMMSFFFFILIGIIIVSILYIQKIKSVQPYFSYNKPRIMLLGHIYSNSYWQIIKNGAERAAAERECVIEYRAPQASSIEENLKIFDMSINAKVDGIIMYVQDEKIFTPYINKAIAKGIPVITIDTDAPESKRLAYIGTDNIYAGKVAGELVADKLGNTAEIGIIIGGKNTNQLERVDGFKEYLEKNTSSKIVDIKSSDSYMVEAKLMVTKMLNDNPNINCIYCTSALDGVGAAKALEDLKKEDIVIISFDDLPETINYIKKGIIYASIVQKPYEMGYKSVNLIMDKIKKKEFLGGQYLTSIKTIKRDNVSQYLQKGELQNEK